MALIVDLGEISLFGKIAKYHKSDGEISQIFVTLPQIRRSFGEIAQITNVLLNLPPKLRAVHERAFM